MTYIFIFVQKLTCWLLFLNFHKVEFKCLVGSKITYKERKWEKERKWNIYLEQAIFKEKTDRISLDEDSVPNNFAKASKVDASAGASRQSEL